MAAGPHPEVLKATDLTAGFRGIVAAVAGPTDVVERLASIGLSAGAAFQVVRAGSPMTVAVGETRLALGLGWAEALRVVPA